MQVLSKIYVEYIVWEYAGMKYAHNWERFDVKMTYYEDFDFDFIMVEHQKNQLIVFYNREVKEMSMHDPNITITMS